MKKTTNSNSGFTLIELVIAMAILAFLMTAVSSFMGTGVIGLKKAKADIDVHTSAQDVYEQISDSIMSANDLIICAYVIQGTLDGTTATSTDASFITAGDPCDQFMDGPFYFARDAKQIEDLKNGSLKKYCLDVKDYKLYENVPEGARLYVKQIIVDRAVAIDPSCTDLALTEDLPKDVTNALTGETVTIKFAERNVDNTKVDETPEGEAPAVTPDYIVTSEGLPVYNVNDTERCIYTFDGKTMYFEREYAYMNKLNDNAGVRTTAVMSPYKYTESFNYLTISGVDDEGNVVVKDTVSGCVLRLDKAKNGLYLEMNFSDKNTTYSTSSMINTRNTYVLRYKK